MTEAIWWIVLARALCGSLGAILRRHSTRAATQDLWIVVGAGINGAQKAILRNETFYARWDTAILSVLGGSAWLALPGLRARGPFHWRELLGAILLFGITFGMTWIAFRKRKERTLLERTAAAATATAAALAPSQEMR